MLMYPAIYLTMGLLVLPWVPLGVFLHAMPPRYF